MATEDQGGQRNQPPRKAGGLGHASTGGRRSRSYGRGAHNGSGRHGPSCPDKPHTELAHESPIVSGLPPHVTEVSLRDGKSRFRRWSSISRLFVVRFRGAAGPSPPVSPTSSR